MKTKLPCLNYALLASAHAELKSARHALYEAGQRAQDTDDATVLGVCSQAAENAASAVAEMLVVLHAHADSVGAAEALHG